MNIIICYQKYLVHISCLWKNIEILVFNFAGNGMVILIVLTSRRMQTVTNYFIANLALADVVIGLFSIPFQFQVNIYRDYVFRIFKLEMVSAIFTRFLAQKKKDIKIFPFSILRILMKAHFHSGRTSSTMESS